MQCSSNGSSRRESSSSRNSFHGGVRSRDIAKGIRSQIAQEMPLFCFFRTMLLKPSALWLVQFFAEGILFLKFAVGKRLFERLETIPLGCPSRQGHHKT